MEHHRPASILQHVWRGRVLTRSRHPRKGHVMNTTTWTALFARPSSERHGGAALPPGWNGADRVEGGSDGW
jgi:hypothetical protein